MKKREFLMITRILWAAFAFLGMAGSLYASQADVSQLPQSRDTDAVMQRMERRVTPAQRKAAAARIRAAREAKDPGFTARREAARKAFSLTAEARVAALQDNTAPGEVTAGAATRRFKAGKNNFQNHKAKIQLAEANEAAARNAVIAGKTVS